MKHLENFLKGIVVGIGGIAPGLSGSVMLIILGLYEKTVGAIGNLFRNFKRNILFLTPLLLGFGCGILIFSKVVDFLLTQYEFETRYLFLGLVLGTIPLFWKEVQKRGFRKGFYVVILGAAIIGILLFSVNKMFPPVKNPTMLQSTLLGVAVAGSSIVPGVDSAVILSALGLYELYVGSLANLNLDILIPAGVGLALGALCISAVMSFLIKRFYTWTFSVIFGLFLSIIPKVLNERCAIYSVSQLSVVVPLVLLGFVVSFYLGDIKGNHDRIKRTLNR